MANQVRRNVQGQTGGPPTKVRLFITNVQGPRYPLMINPARMHFISDIPDPAAYFARVLTRWAVTNENTPCSRRTVSRPGLFPIQQGGTHGRNNVDQPFHGGEVTPFMPGVTSITFRINLPTTKLLVQPPTVVTVPHLEVGKPFSYD
jgi:hypothetical protein